MSDKRRCPIEVRNYMASLGKRGGQRKTPAQVAACSRNLAAARIARLKKVLAEKTDPKERGKLERTILAHEAKLRRM